MEKDSKKLQKKKKDEIELVLPEGCNTYDPPRSDDEDEGGGSSGGNSKKPGNTSKNQ